ncbi:DUF5067 domain-containing protein [Parvibacter caecicola]|uniref:DUF5067 domain-containing protein n=1 Tax=Parvibacter caecicola TaxID=747645 RepID=A0A4T9T889_9ACTN|nr:DUF5067 domain-containing protein [Parvibacter caecicola]TJW11258.1 DUF5067 domain-containing protein [Parvibacter caecicola]
MEKKPTSGLGVASLVTGIIALFSAFVPLLNLLSFPFVLLAVIFGAVGIWQTVKGTKGGKGIAIAGLVLGVLALVVTVAMYATAGSGQQTADDVPAPSQQQAAQQQSAQGEDQQPQAAQSSQESTSYEVVIGEARTVEDYQGNPAVVVSYTFTNNSDEAVSPMVAVHAKAFQNGVELDTAFLTEDAETAKAMNEVKPGASITYEDAYKLTDTASDVLVEVEELFSFSDELLAEKTFSF